MKKVLIIDTSILCVWLKVPGKETCGTKRSPNHATEIFTGDEGLKSYEPQGERIFVPRRRKI